MTKYLFFCISLLLVLSLGSCRRQPLTRAAKATVPASADSSVANRPPITDTATVVSPSRTGTDIARTHATTINFHYLTTKSKLSFDTPQQDIDNANVTIRVCQDSLIWLSVSKLGIEAVRGLITRDSITIVDKLHHDYAVYDFRTLSRQFNFTLTFDLLQAILVNNLPLAEQPVQATKDEADYAVVQQSDGTVLVDNYIGKSDHKLRKWTMIDQPTQNKVAVVYENFTALASTLFPYASTVTLNYRSRADDLSRQTTVNIKHSRVDVTDKNPGFPFSIPASYQRRP